MRKGRVVLAGVLACLLLVSCAPTKQMVNFTLSAKQSGETGSGLESELSLINGLKPAGNTVVIYDASGSMLWLETDGKPRYKTLYQAFVKSFVEKTPEKENVGLIVFGSRYASGIRGNEIHNAAAAKKSCMEDIEVAIPLGKFNKTKFQGQIERLADEKSYHGDTPLGNSIKKAIELLDTAPGENKRILLYTDGSDECFGKVPGCISVQEAKKMAENKGILVESVGFAFGLNREGKVDANKLSETRKSFEGIPVFEANNLEQLNQGIAKSQIKTFPFTLLDRNGKVVAPNVILGEPVSIDVGSYTGLQTKIAGTTKIKFTVSAKAERPFNKAIGIPSNQTDVKVWFGMKSLTDTDPDIEPEEMKWTQ